MMDYLVFATTLYPINSNSQPATLTSLIPRLKSYQRLFRNNAYYFSQCLRFNYKSLSIVLSMSVLRNAIVRINTVEPSV